jgi:hypothetical protein
MTTPRDLFLVTVYDAAARPVEQGDLSLALAGAELVDLFDAGAVTLDGELIVPAPAGATEDRLLGEAAAALRRETPYESVEDWLWRRGRGLSSVYLTVFEEEGRFTRQHRRWLPSWTGVASLVDSPDRRRATDRWTSEEPVLATLAATVGIRDMPTAELPDEVGEAVATVLAAVDDAVTELTAVRQRRDIEKAAFDNIWRGPA